MTGGGGCSSGVEKEQRERINLAIEKKNQQATCIIFLKVVVSRDTWTLYLFCILRLQKCPKIILGNHCMPKLLNGTKFLLL